MANQIRLLPENVANQIAAGEVVQRPASVVKELMENAVDAGATRVELIVKDAGKTLIQVIDNGAGMSPADAKLAFERHATSKIKSANDLFDLHTNGFRGEALASIAAVSHVRLRTKPENEELGTEIRIDGGEIKSNAQVQMSTGTVIEVRDLFYNIPARRNFLKGNSVETRHIVDAFQRVAFTAPEIRFRLVHNDNEVFNLPPSQTDNLSANLRQRIVGIMGRNTNEKLVPIQEDTEILKITGFVGKPSHSKKKRGEQFFFVNNRFIKHNYLNHAVLNAFEGLIPPGSYPAYYLFLEVPPQSLDVNIHPTKTEVKFDNERDLYAIIRSTVKHSLGQYNVSPSLDFERDAGLDTPYAYKDKSTVKSPSIQVDKDFNPFRKEYSAAAGARRKETLQQWEALYLDNGPEKELIHSIEVEAEDISQQLFDENEGLDVLRTFQLHAKYVASSIKSGMVLIDQNAAHQRILYEDYLEKVTLEGIGHQQLLFPLKVTLTSNEIRILKDVQSDLETAGFHIAQMGEDHITLDAIPVSIAEKQVNQVLEELAGNIKNEVPDTSFSQIDTIAKSLAKSLSIKAGTPLNSKEQESLVNNLFSCKEPNYSPSGKKTFITISMEDLEQRFNT
jgi:DNA mismatch repair protein MutL